MRNINMPSDWKQKYKELTDFISGHPEVNITKTLVQIPAGTRPDFYKLFDAVRMAVLTDRFPEFISNIATLVENYARIEREVIKLLELKSVSIPHRLSEFLQHPADELIRGLFHILFDLLQGKIDTQRFEEISMREIQSSFNQLYQSGYEKWITLSLLNLLSSDKLFQVNLSHFPKTKPWKKGNKLQDDVPAPEVSNCILFNSYGNDNMFIIPDVIFHSASLNGYVAIRSEIGRSLITAKNASEKREWYPFDQDLAPATGLTLVYLADSPEEISLVADARKICRPDLIIVQCGWQKDWYWKEGMEAVKSYHFKFKPKLGTYAVFKKPMPAYPQMENLDGIHNLTIGFDQSKLQIIIDVLLKHEDKFLT
jgi:hypothetical protein